MRKNIDELDIQIRNGLDKIYGIAALPEKQRNRKHKHFIYSSQKNIQADKFKAKLLHFIATERGIKFVSLLQFKPIKTLWNEFHIPFALPFKNDDRNKDCVSEVVNTSGMEIPTPMGYNKWKKTFDTLPKKHWKEIPKHKQPARLTTGKQPLKKVTETILTGNNDPRYGSYISDFTLRPIRYKGWTTFIHEHWERPNSEAGYFHKIYTSAGHMTAEQYMLKLENHKMEKWIRKHPKPTEKELKQDLFPELMNAEWNTREHNAREFIRQHLRAKYDKTSLPVIGRFETSPDKWEERIIGYISDPHNLAEHINDDYYGGNDMNPILKQAYEIFDKEAEKHPELTNGYIQNAAKTRGRVLIRKHELKLSINLGGNKTLNLTRTFAAAA